MQKAAVLHLREFLPRFESVYASANCGPLSLGTTPKLVFLTHPLK